MNAELAQRVADRAAAVRGVARLTGGLTGMGTYAPGHRIEGVRVREGHVEIRLVAAGSIAPLPTIADAVRDAVGTIVPGSRIDVFIDDLDLDVLDLDVLESASATPANSVSPGSPR